MKKSNFPNQFQDYKSEFKGKRFEVYSGKIEGTDKRREVIIHPGAVVILPILDENHILLIKNERFVVNETLWELPAGTLELNEKPLDTAKRELIEETGYEATEVKVLTQFYTTPGICNEIMYAYVATNLTFVGQKLDDMEKITVEKVAWKDVLKMINDGIICDGKTIATLLFYQTFYKK